MIMKRQQFGNFFLLKVFGLVLLIVCFLSAIGVVYTAYLNRLAFNRLQVELTQKNIAQEEWEQLLLQHSALIAHSRVERLAIEELFMETPAKSAVILGSYD